MTSSARSPEPQISIVIPIYNEQAILHAAVVDLRERVLLDLVREGVVTGQRLVAEHSVVLDPAYVHITRRSMAERERLGAMLQERSVWSLGRYGGWTYCSIEDNMLETRALAHQL